MAAALRARDIVRSPWKRARLHVQPPGSNTDRNLCLLLPNDSHWVRLLRRGERSKLGNHLQLGMRRVSTTAPTEAAALVGDPVRKWGVSSRRSSEYPLLLLFDQSNKQLGVINYSHGSTEDRPIDVVMRIEYDPAFLRPAAVAQHPDRIDLHHEAGVRAPGEYWVRLHGNVQAGTGLLAQIPFIRLTEETPKRWGTITIFE